MTRQTLSMWNIIISIIIVRLTVGYFECIFSKRYKIINIHQFSFWDGEPKPSLACDSCALRAKLSSAPRVLLGSSPAIWAKTLWVLSLNLPLCALRVVLWAFKLCLNPSAHWAWFLEPVSFWLSLCALRVVRRTVSSSSLRAKARLLGSLSSFLRTGRILRQSS